MDAARHRCARRRRRPAARGPGVWPPAGATALDAGDLYARMAEHGFDYGPAFRGLVRAWRRADEVFAELALPEAAGPLTAGTVHPRCWTRPARRPAPRHVRRAGPGAVLLVGSTRR
ncbi:polyketide synthase dehydratase domain-containing protein [Streptomyces chrestomyceticus]|uniref:polyketide synthase dehydratase domain-containing protein n=1 Tax=Streptomyces chrestomyceticus TaxID=68185 RepID=UPI000F626F4F|nr:polyketide synthase dehydratase domain-containing protein [Streptomyces chrestomyceticus]